MKVELNDRTLFKVLDEEGYSTYADAKWYRPTAKRAGRWMPEIQGDLELCSNGYHLCRGIHVLDWLGPVLYIADVRGDVLEGDNKLAVRQARLIKRLDTWNERIARLFACDCAEHALERVGNADPQSVEAVRIARLYAHGGATSDQLAAARVAAGAAAGDAARAAAWAAAFDAAGDAARAAAWAAAFDAAFDAAGDAARAAAWAAAFDAARAAARAAARQWQFERLLYYLRGEAQ